jgi:hypothetical protein
MKHPVTIGEAARLVLSIALALPFAWQGYREVHLLATSAALSTVFVLLVVAMVRLWTDRRRLPRWRRVLPLLVCLAVPYGGLAGGAVADRLDFRLRRQAHYRHVVEMLEHGEIVSKSTATASFELPPPYEGESRGAIVTRDAAGGLVVDFFWGRKTSYAYCKQNACTPDHAWRSYRRINEEWLYVRR